MSLSVFGRSLVRGMQYSFLLKRGPSHRRELSPVYLWKTQVSTRSWQSCRLDTWMWSGPKFVSKSVYYASFTFCFLLLIKPPFSARSTRLLSDIVEKITKFSPLLRSDSIASVSFIFEWLNTTLIFCFLCFLFNLWYFDFLINFRLFFLGFLFLLFFCLFFFSFLLLGLLGLRKLSSLSVFCCLKKCLNPMPLCWTFNLKSSLRWSSWCYGHQTVKMICQLR